MIRTFEQRSLTIDLSLWRTFRWIFLIADIRVPTIGAGFLWDFKLVVDICLSRLLDSETHLTVQGVASCLAPLRLIQAHAKVSPQWSSLLEEFSDLSCAPSLEDSVCHMLHITLQQREHWFLHVVIISPLPSTRSRGKNSSTCSNSGTFVLPMDHGHCRYTWSPSLQETGDRVMTTRLSTK